MGARAGADVCRVLLTILSGSKQCSNLSALTHLTFVNVSQWLGQQRFQPFAHNGDNNVLL